MNYTINFYHLKQKREKARLLSVAPKKTDSLVKRMIRKASSIGLIASLFIGSILIAPDAFYRFVQYDPQLIEASIEESPLAGSFEDGALYSTVQLPPLNENLPEGRWVTIPKIGVRTEILEETLEDHENALQKGVWRYTDLGTPEESGGPMILIAHRFGYLKWTNAYRRQHSFYNLDKLEIGDTFEVIWDQRRYEYEIYAGEEAQEISDYSADIILYTCKYLNSNVRILRYARRVEY